MPLYYEGLSYRRIILIQVVGAALLMILEMMFCEIAKL
jgi:hypothetical protein